MKTDAQITRAVVDALFWDPSVSSDGISVTTEAGIVTLSGSVPHPEERRAAERAALRVRGVKTIVAVLDVNRFEAHGPLEAALARAVSQALAWRFWIPDSVKATIEHRQVALAGEVRWEFQRKAAHAAVRDLPGVTALSCEIVVVPARPWNWARASDTAVRLLRRALGRAEEPIEAFQDVPENEQVTLPGYAQSWEEREAYGWAAWRGRERRLKSPERAQAKRRP